MAKFLNTRLKKISFIVTGFIIVTVIIVILMLSPITKYLIEKYDVKYTGRQIKTGLVYINPFTGYVYIGNFKIFEPKSGLNSEQSDSVFFSAKGISINLSLTKLFSKTIEISEFTLDQPKGIIIQNKKDFNFNDLVKKFSSKDSVPKQSSFHVNILNIKIKNGEFYYHEKQIPINYSIKKVNFESSGKYWNADTMAVKFSFFSGTGSGSVNGNITVDLKNLDYRLAIVIEKFDMTIIEQYLKDLANYGHFSATLDANIRSKGNFNDVERVTNSGLLVINDFHFGKDSKVDYASFDKLAIAINELSPRKHIYSYDSISLSHPNIKYERYDYLDNFQRMFGEKGVNISAVKEDPAKFNLILKIADYIKAMGKNFLKSDFKINRLAIYNGVLKFNDYSLSEKFSMEANPLNVFADSIDKHRKQVGITLKSGIQPYGNIMIALKINPRDSSDFDMKYRLQNLPLSLFNPYLITYTSFPVDRGSIEFNGNWNVRNGMIKSDNHLLVIDPRVGRRLKNKFTKWIPLRLVMFFVRERGNVIDYQIPVTGNLKDPKFHLHDVIFHTLENIFVKPVATPYIARVKTTENEIEKSLTLKWKIRQATMERNQERFINKMADFLKNNHDASIVVYPIQYAEKEKENILFFEAKKKYFLVSNKIQTISKDDSIKVDMMSVKDSLFVKYLNRHLKDSMLFTIQEKCSKFIGLGIVNGKFKQLNDEREAAFIFHFKEKAVENRVKINTAENTIPYNGFSFFKIVYNGEFPKSLINAYQQMKELNNVSPRKTFKKERNKNEKTL